MSKKYPDLTETNFPESVDNLYRMSDLTIDDLPLVKQFYEYYDTGNLTAANALLDTYPDLKPKIFNAKKFNKFIDGNIAVQRWFKDEIYTYFQNKQTEIDNKANEAANSATDANTFANNAKTSETNSANSASASKISETNSKTSETNSANSANEAANSAYNANTAKVNAETAANNSANSASDAADSAQSAARSATYAKEIVGGNFATRKVPSSSGNIAILDATGNLADSGKKTSDYVSMSLSLNQATPVEINSYSTNGFASNLWNIGDVTAPITLTTGEQIVLQVADFDHDDLVNGGKAGISFVMKNSFKKIQKMNPTNTNAGGWGSSELRQKMSTYISQFPDEWQAVFKQVKKETSAGNQSSSIVTTNDYLWLPSYTEVNILEASFSTLTKEGFAYPLFTDNASRIKKRYDSSDFWWLRSPIPSGSNYFGRIHEDGSVSLGKPSQDNGVVLGLCI